MDGLRAGADTALGLDDLKGLVSFPGFHAAAAVMLGWGYWSLPWLRWLFLALNVAMTLSAIPIGGHDLADILAGILVAVLSILCARQSTNVSTCSNPHGREHGIALMRRSVYPASP